MRRFRMGALVAAMTAGGALVLIGSSASGVASATVTPNAPIPTTSQAGYVATHNTFRYVTTSGREDSDGLYLAVSGGQQRDQAAVWPEAGDRAAGLCGPDP